MATLEENINKVISDFDSIEEAIVEKGVEVPYGTNTSEYGNLIRQVSGGAINPENLKKLNVQHAVIADLEPGAYLWEYDDVKTLDYYSGMKDIYQNPTFLQITVTGDGGQKDFYLFDDGYGADESRQELIWGAIYINSETGTPDEGFCNSRFLYDIPSREQEFNVDTNGQPISLCGSSVGLYAPQSDSCIEFYVGESDETSITMSPGGIDVAAHNGNLNLYADSSIYLTAESGDIVFENSSFFKTTATFESDVYFVGDATFNNGLTLNESLYLANNGEIADTEDRLSIYKGTGSMWIGTEEGGCIEITDDNFFVESFNNLNLVSNSDITFSSQNGSTYFSGNVDFTNANVTGLNVGGGSGGLSKTKVTLAELRTILASYTSHLGEILQIIYKGTNTTIRAIMDRIGGVHQIDSPTISVRVGSTDASDSAISGSNDELSITSISAYVKRSSWDFDIENKVTNITAGTQWNITDTDYEFYIIGE